MLDLHSPISEAYKKTAEYKRLKAFSNNLDKHPEEKTRFLQGLNLLDKAGNPNQNFFKLRKAIELVS